MKRKQFTACTLIALGLLLFVQCRKEENVGVNLSSMLSITASQLNVTEGEEVTFEMNLSEKLSEDLFLNFNFSVVDINNYINKEDYSSNIEMQTEGTSSWRAFPHDRVLFPANSSAARFRLQTIDDDKLEVTEVVNLTIEKATASSQITLENTTPFQMRMTVRDNETPAIQHNYKDDGGIMVFAFDDEYNPTLVSINPTIEFPEQKAFIDAGVIPAAMLTDLQTVFRRSTTPITHYIFEYQRGDEAGAYVLPTQQIYGSERTTDAWVMMIDAGIAYPELAMGNNAYNENGRFGFFLFHEWGHIETLNRDTQLNKTTVQAECITYFEDEGCLNSDAALYQFMLRFYNINRENEHTNSPISALNTPAFVTDYARKNNAEDIAESFAYYITQDDIPVANASSSGALQKINFIKNYATFTPYRALRNQVNTKLNEALGEIPHFNRSKQGKRISCLDRKGLAEMRKSLE